MRRSQATVGGKRSNCSRCLNRHNGYDAHDDGAHDEGAIWGYRQMQKPTAPGRSLRGPSPASGDAESTGAPDRDAPNAKIKCVITRAGRACFGSNGAWALVFEVAASAPCTNASSHHRNLASVARLLSANGRDRPEIRAVAAHSVITGTFKHATIVVEAVTRIAGYGITGRNYFGTGTRCA